MTLHCKVDAQTTENGVCLGNVQLWADNTDDPMQRLLAEAMAKCLRDFVEGMNAMSEALFDPPKEKQA